MESDTEDQSLQLLLDCSPAAALGPIGGSRPEPAEEAPWNWSEGFALDIARATRTWIQYGMVGFAVACIVIGAIKGALGF